VLGYGTILWIRQVILTATSNSKSARSLPPASIHPILGLFGLALFASFGLVDILVSLLVFGLFFASAVAYTEIAKRPLLRSFGVDGLKLLRSTLDHYTDPGEAGVRELESFFDSISVPARVRVAGLAFRSSKGIKAIFLAPTVHPGPMGYVGGSDLPTKVAQDLSDLTPNVIVAHGPTTHDENAATTAEVRKVAEAARSALASTDFRRSVGPPRRAMFGRASALAQAFGDVVMIVASFAPNPTDDIDSATGFAAVQEARLAGVADAVFVDAHNCMERGSGLTHFGSSASHDVLGAARKAALAALAAPKGPLRVGHASRRGICEPEDGIGSEGIQALVTEVAERKTAVVVFDGNNMIPGLRDQILERLRPLVDDAEVLTTDNHSVNMTMGGFNPVGLKFDQAQLVDLTEAVVKEAMAAMAPAVGGIATGFVDDLVIFGPESAARLTTSLNSTVAVLRPAFVATFLLALTASVLSLFLLD